MRMRRLEGAAVLAVALLAVLIASGTKDGDAEGKWDQRACMNLHGIQFLENFPKEKIQLFPAECQMVGYTSQLNPEADYHATNEVPGLEVYQDPGRFETLYVKRDGEYGRYTMTLALCPLLCYAESLYIREDSLDANDLPYITVAEGRRPSDKRFAPTGETLSLGAEGTLPRRALETNDARTDGAQVLAASEGLDYLYVEEDGGRELYVRIASCDFPGAWTWAAQGNEDGGVKTERIAQILADIGKPLAALEREHPEGTLFDRPDGFPDAAAICFGEPDAQIAYVLLGTQYLGEYRAFMDAYADRLECCGILSKVGVLFPDTAT